MPRKGLVLVMNGLIAVPSRPERDAALVVPKRPGTAEDALVTDGGRGLVGRGA